MSRVLFAIDEIDEADMMFEIGKREGLRAQGLCDYCSRPWGIKPACQFPHRHSPTHAVRERSKKLRHPNRRQTLRQEPDGS
jgi:hypothetical protein